MGEDEILVRVFLGQSDDELSTLSCEVTDPQGAKRCLEGTKITVEKSRWSKWKWWPAPSNKEERKKEKLLLNKVEAGFTTSRRLARQLQRSRKIDFSIPLSSGTVIKKIDLSGTVAGETVKISVLAPNVGLACLLPENEAEFRGAFTFRKGRHVDPRMIRFIAMQVLERAKVDDLESLGKIGFGYYVNAFVIYIYKSIETSSVEEVSVTEYGVLAKKCIEAMAEGTSEDVRESKLQILLSYHTALYHHYIAKRVVDQAEPHLLEMESLWLNPDSRFLTTYSYNYSKSLLLLGIIRFLRGEVELAQRTWKDVIACFERAVAIKTRHLIKFQELGVAHQVASMALMLLDSARSNNSQVFFRDAQTALPSAFRIDSQDFLKNAKEAVFNKVN